MDIRKVGLMSKNTTYITLPQGFCRKGDSVKVEIINEKELKITLID